MAKFGSWFGAVVFFGAALFGIGTPAAAQSPCQYITYGAILTSGQWNYCFTQKNDYLGAPPLLTTGGVMTGPITTEAASNAGAGLNLPPGIAPTTPNNGDLWTTSAGVFARVNGSTINLGASGAGAVNSVGNSDSTLTISPNTGAVIASLNLGNANTWTAVQTFTNSDLALLGSSTGATTFRSANAGATNYTVTVPAATDTVALLAATQTFTNKSIAASEINSGTLGCSQQSTFTGDATTPGGSCALTLATVNSNTGTFGSATSVPVITVTGKGTVTAVTSAPILPFNTTAVLQDQETQNTAGQSVSGSATTVAKLNTKTDPGSIITSFSSNQFTLAAGTYLIQWSVPFHNTSVGGLFQSALYNVTTSAVTTYGQSAGAITTAAIDFFSQGWAIVTVAGSTTFELQVTNAVSGTIGYPSNFGTEVYASTTITLL